MGDDKAEIGDGVAAIELGNETVIRVQSDGCDICGNHAIGICFPKPSAMVPESLKEGVLVCSQHRDEIDVPYEPDEYEYKEF